MVLRSLRDSFRGSFPNPVHGLGRWLPVCALAIAIASAGCGSDKKKDDTTPTGDCTGDACLGAGWVAKASGAVVTVDFAKAAADDQYVVLPYVLDDPAKVTGANDTKFTWTIGVGAAAAGGAGFSDGLGGSDGLSDGNGLAARQAPRAKAPRLMTPDERDHNLRTLMNRYDPDKGTAQSDGFWQLARALDDDERLQVDGGLKEFAAADTGDGIESYYRRGAASGPTRTHADLLLLDASKCPSGNVPVPTKADPNTPVDVDFTGTAVDGGDYCIVYVDDPVTPGDKTAVEATVKEVIRRYKTILYNDTFAPAKDQYIFKPVIVIADFSNAAHWPVGGGLSGAFINGQSKDAGTPMIYMPSDYKQLDKNKTDANYDAAVNKRLWHGTIAHEMQHAVMNYWKVHVAGLDQETASIDEGIAHYIEDLFGHGVDNFASFPKPYLQTWYDKDADAPALHQTDSSAVARGAGQTFIYYLTSQKGGATFDANGAFSGGGGLVFLAAAVKAAATGPANLGAVFGGDWTETVGDYFAALAVDGSGYTGTDAKFQVKDPQQVTDLIGEASQTFGMHFNGFLDLPKKQTFSLALADKAKTPEVQYYATKPLLYTVKDPTQQVTFTAAAATPNMAVAVIRIK